ncbi:CPBP family intramembrane glutamic endopeptidase [Microbacterium sp. 1.5R]|uniref:CPBP family intramembrane glutamic endopeptidase n=1 Tax=Microbacterium sp. 1.5R TaxID=1916917 RepID=UPI0011AA6142|nr:CPBP family intramembrane glutamic endopeptidase [Microbacterium sp. 1.5R]
MTEPGERPAPASTSSSRSDRVPRLLGIGLIAVAVYVAVAAGGGALVDALGAADADPASELALTHLIPLPLAVAGGLVFARVSGWWADVWSDPPLSRSTPRRLWWWLVPVVVAVQIAALVGEVHWPLLSVAYVAVGVLAYLLVGLGEELFFRGILLESVRAHHGETVVLLTTALGFGLAHSVGSLMGGVPISTIAFQVGVTSMEGVLFYAALRVTGTLWAPITLHGLGDLARWLAVPGSHGDAPPLATGTQVAMTVLAAAILLSVLCEDRRRRKPRIPAAAGA